MDRGGGIIYSGKDDAPLGLLTLTALRTRRDIARKILGRTAASATAEIDKMER